MTWQEIVFDILPLVISFVSAVILFFRTGQKRYITRFVEILNQIFQSDSDSDVVSTDRDVKSQVVTDDDWSQVTLSTPSEFLSFHPSDYGMTANQVISVFRSFLESRKNGDDK